MGRGDGSSSEVPISGVSGQVPKSFPIQGKTGHVALHGRQVPKSFPIQGKTGLRRPRHVALHGRQVLPFILSRGKRLVPLFLPAILSFILCLIIGFWEEWKNNRDLRMDLEDWERQIEGRAEEFRANLTESSLIRESATRLNSTLRKLISSQGIDALTGGSFRRLADRAFDPRIFPRPIRLFAFRIGSGDETIPISGPGLEKSGTKLMGSILTQVFRSGTPKHSPAGTGGEGTPKHSPAAPAGEGSVRSDGSPKTSKLLGRLLGTLITPDVLAFHNSGRPVSVVFEGRPARFAWSIVLEGRRPVAGFAVVLPKRIPRAALLRHNLRRFVHRGEGRFKPILVPLSPASGSLRILKMPGKIDYSFFSSLLDGRVPHSVFTGIASLGQAVNAGDYFYRAPLGKEAPYELWVTGPNPHGKSVARFGTVALMAWAAFWIFPALVFLLSREMPRLPLSLWVPALLVLAAGIPLSAAYAIGSYFIETGLERRISGSLADAVSKLEGIEFEGARQLTIFTELSRKMISSSAFVQALLSVESAVDSPAILDGSRDFARRGVPLESIMVFPFGKPHFAWIPGGGKGGSPRCDRRFPPLEFILPLAYGSFDFLEPGSFASASKVLSAEQRESFFAYKQIDSDLCANISNLRGKGFHFSIGESQFFQVMDLVAGPDGHLIAAVIFRGRADLALFELASKRISWLSRRSPGMMLGMLLDARHGRRSFIRPREILDTEVGKSFGRVLSQTAANRSRPLLLKHGLGFVGYSGRNIRTLALATTADLAPARNWARDRYLALRIAAALMFLGILFLGRGLSRFFLAPLSGLERAMETILSGNFSARVPLERDDELGETAKEFNRMAEGLERRSDLGKFVSQALDVTIRKQSDIHREARRETGVVLASDIRGFTTITESNPPRKVVEMLNSHLEAMSSAISENQGLVDKFIGDAIVGIFLSPDPAKAVGCAIRAAREMLIRQRAIIEERKRSGLFAYRMGIGIEVGELLICSFGSEERLEYSFIGKPRDSAEKLESASRAGRGTRIIVSEAVRALCPETRANRLAGTPFYEVAEE